MRNRPEPDDAIPTSAEQARARSDRNAALWTPPVIVMLLGTAFLCYRSAATDWRGVSALFESTPAVAPETAVASIAPVVKPKAPLKAEAPKVDEPAPIAQADAPKSDEPAKDDPAAVASVDDPAKPAAEAPAAGADDPLADIQREAEKTKQRIAELEKLKKDEERKLAETEDQRRREAPPDRRQNIDKVIAAHRKQFERQMAMMEQMQKKAMQDMEKMQRDFFAGRGGMGMGPLPRIGDLQRELNALQQRGLGGFNAFPPELADPVAPPPPQPHVAPQIRGGDRPARRPANPGLAQADPNTKTLREGTHRFPDGTLGRFREFQGPMGMRGFVWEYRRDGDTPPPPEPDPDAKPKRRAPVFD